MNSTKAQDVINDNTLCSICSIHNFILKPLFRTLTNYNKTVTATVHQNILAKYKTRYSTCTLKCTLQYGAHLQYMCTINCKGKTGTNGNLH